LAHWRDKDAVNEFDIANRERIEEVSHANTLALQIALGDNLPITQQGCAILNLNEAKNVAEIS
jgi:hypothetical protein